MRTLLLVLALLSALSLSAQKKKKDPYAAYWAQQELEEQFQKLSKEGHDFFEQHKLKEAQEKYKQALLIKPDDQQTKAILHDIDLLLQSKEPEVKTYIPIPPKPPVPNPPPVSTAEENPVPQESPITEPKPEPKPEPLPQAKPERKSTSPTPEPKPKAKTSVVTDEVPEKGTPEFRAYLGNQFPSGWTEEKYKEGNKDITKRVCVENGIGDEYLEVKHHYGAVFYFKNGRSISYATWIAETEKN